MTWDWVDFVSGLSMGLLVSVSLSRQGQRIIENGERLIAQQDELLAKLQARSGKQESNEGKR